MNGSVRLTDEERDGGAIAAETLARACTLFEERGAIIVDPADIATLGQFLIKRKVKQVVADFAANVRNELARSARARRIQNRAGVKKHAE